MAGTLYIISAPSGAGKSSLIQALLKTHPEYCMQVSISHTTRLPRPGEQDALHYHFISHQEFEQLIHQDLFLEYAKVFEHYYGTALPELQKNLAKGIDVFLDIDWQGAQQVRNKMPMAKSIFILPPSLEELEQRLIKRGQDSQEVIQRRMDKAISEMSHYDEYDYVIVNDHFEQSLEQLCHILQAEKLKTDQQQEQHATLIKQLLAKKA